MVDDPASSIDTTHEDELDRVQSLEEQNPHEENGHRRRPGHDRHVLYAPLSIEDGREDQPQPIERPSRSFVRPCEGLCCCCRQRPKCCIFFTLILFTGLFLVVHEYYPSLFILPSSWSNKWRSTPKSTHHCPNVTSGSIDLIQVHPTNIDLNRHTKKLDHLPPHAHYGFLWDDEDVDTLNWRPQGITVAMFDKNQTTTTTYALISWYGRADQDYENRGARIAFVDMTQGKYRHVLLVDSHLCTMPSLHAGGLVYRQGKLHVPDSRHKGQSVRVFDLVMGLYKATPEVAEEYFYKHCYILVQESEYWVPTVPSFMSYNSNLDLLMVGTYSHCTDNPLQHHVDSYECKSRLENRLAWYNLTDEETPTDNHGWLLCTPFFSEMQGVAVASANDEMLVLFVVSSYGPVFDSHLHVVSNFDSSCLHNHSMWNNDSDTVHYRTLSYPPGLEDLHIEVNDNEKRDIWMLTEFGSRPVFVTDLENLLP